MTTQPALDAAGIVLHDLEPTRTHLSGVEGGGIAVVVVIEPPAEELEASAIVAQPQAPVRSEVVVEAPEVPSVMSADEQLLARAFERMGYVPARSEL